MIGSAGNTGNVASVNAMVDTIEGIAGPRSMVEANEALAARGLLAEMPSPDYGYVRSSLILHERMDFNIYNDWVSGSLNELAYTDRQRGKRPIRVIHMPTAKVCVQIPHEVYPRSRSERRYVG